MNVIRLAFLLGAIQFVAGAQNFAGRWDITAFDQDQPRAWWLEVTAGQPVRGRFTGAPGGQTEDIQDIAIQNDELRFAMKKRWRAGDEPETGIFTARLVNGKLDGVFSLGNGTKLQWTGKRAPAIPDQDDGTWREAKPVRLFNGKDLSGWVPHGSPVVFRPAARPGDFNESGWSVQDGILSTQGRGTSLVTEKKFWNYLLHVEFRVTPGGNSGIGLRGRYELQIIDDNGRPVNGHSTGGIYGRILPAVNASKPAGEWQTYDVRLVGRWVTVVLNGTKLIDKGEIEGLTAIAIDSNEDEPGPICLQGDHGAVDFRNIVLTPLIK
jgi:hypothetical protein